MRFGLDVATSGPYADVRLLADLAAEAEAAGWDGFFVWDILLSDDEADPGRPVSDPWVALAAVALATQRIRIGALMTPLPRRRPWQVARTVASLDQLSGGRVTLGAGLGYRAREYEAVGEEADPRVRAARLDEGLHLVDRLLRGETVTFDGTYHRVEALRLAPSPVQRPRVPIWTAAGWPRRRPVLRAARWDGVYLMQYDQDTGRMLAPGDVAQVAALVRAERGDAPFDIAVNGVVDGQADPARVVAELEQAGATWWVELPPGADEPVERYRLRIRQGPPRTATVAGGRRRWPPVPIRAAATHADPHGRNGAVPPAADKAAADARHVHRGGL